VNDTEVADIVRHALQWSCVRGVTFQPVQDAGRNEGFDSTTNRVVLSEIRRRVGESGVFSLDDMIPLPCNPDQICIGYGLRQGQEVLPITSLLPREIMLNGPNTISYESYPELRGRIFDLLSLATAQVNTEEKLASLLCCLPEAMVPADLSYANSFRVVILQFLDRYNFDLGTVKRSCVHFLTEGGQIIPFDTFNTFYRTNAEGSAVLARHRNLARRHPAGDRYSHCRGQRTLLPRDVCRGLHRVRSGFDHCHGDDRRRPSVPDWRWTFSGWAGAAEIGPAEAAGRGAPCAARRSAVALYLYISTPRHAAPRQVAGAAWPRRAGNVIGIYTTACPPDLGLEATTIPAGGRHDAGIFRTDNDM
jgi:hypothetical protein